LLSMPRARENPLTKAVLAPPRISNIQARPSTISRTSVPKAWPSHSKGLVFSCIGALPVRWDRYHSRDLGGVRSSGGGLWGWIPPLPPPLSRKGRGARSGVCLTSLLSAASALLPLPLRERAGERGSRPSDPLNHRRYTLAQTNAQADQRITLAGTLELAQGGQGQAGTGGAQRVANGDGPTVGVQAGIVEGDAQLLGATQHLDGEGFVDLDHVHVVQRQTSSGEGFLAGLNRAQAHHPRCNTGYGTSENTGAGLEVVFLADGFAANDQRCGAIVDAGGVTGGDHAVAKQRAQTGQGGQVTGRARMLVLVHHLVRLLAALGHFDGVDFLGEEAFGT